MFAATKLSRLIEADRNQSLVVNCSSRDRALRYLRNFHPAINQNFGEIIYRNSTSVSLKRAKIFFDDPNCMSSKICLTACTFLYVRLELFKSYMMQLTSHSKASHSLILARTQIRTLSQTLMPLLIQYLHVQAVTALGQHFFLSAFAQIARIPLYMSRNTQIARQITHSHHGLSSSNARQSVYLDLGKHASMGYYVRVMVESQPANLGSMLWIWSCLSNLAIMTTSQ